MKLSVIIPTYNEAKTLAQLIKKTLAVPINKEIIVVDDGSTDDTQSVLKEFENMDDVILLSHGYNRGKGRAIRTGREKTSGDITIIQDADLETNPNDYLHLVEPIIQKSTKVVYGSRLLNQSADHNWKYYYGGRFITFIANLLYRQNITDEPTCYKVFDTAFFKSIPLECERFEFCPEITAKVSKRGIKIVELPMEYFPRKASEGKKLKMKDGFKALWVLLKYRFKN
ncbi:MAG: glycosyl transferase [Bacteroidetes bacterium 43-16]|nr:MAG: glycosyl transferase [Bacteroidetes bacterium 43-16]